ncbi:MAG: glycosyltransferase family 39 protein [Clostridia bacterium]|nr:glycosyltransferase family 39 protein [Clostridia bacterium]
MRAIINKLSFKRLVILEVLAVLLLFAVALYVRLKFVFGINHPPLLTDAFNYDAMTRQFLEKGFLGYMSQKPNAYITPGYPLFLAAIYSIFGYMPSSPLLQVRIVQSVLGSLTCIIVYLTGRRLKSKATGLIAGSSYALYPTFAWSCTLILTEVLFNFLFLIYVYLQVRILENKSRVESFFCGLVFAAAVLVRPVIFPLLAVPFAYQYFIASKNDKRIIRIFLYALAGVVLLMAPWWIRNIVVLNKFILLATQTGNPLIAGTFPYFANIDLSRYNVSDQFAEGIRLIIKGFATQPLLYLKWFTVGKWNFIFGYPWYYAPAEFTFLKSVWFLHYVVIVLGWLGVLFSLIKNRLRVIALFALMLTCLQLLFVPEARYAYSIIPLLMLLMGNVVDFLLIESKQGC